jgi:hypothetical protein
MHAGTRRTTHSHAQTALNKQGNHDEHKQTAGVQGGWALKARSDSVPSALHPRHSLRLEGQFDGSDAGFGGCDS